MWDVLREDRVVYLRREPAREARFVEPEQPLTEPLGRLLEAREIPGLWAHQARALDLARAGRDVLLATGTASGKTLAFQLPLLEVLAADPGARALLVHPTKALSRDQHLSLRRAARDAGIGIEAGVFDGDTSATERRRLRDRARVILTNPDTLHAAILPEHGRFAAFLSGLRIVVLDEVHVYDGIFGANVANLLRRFDRVLRHYGAAPRMVAASATIGNPGEHGRRLTGRPLTVIDDDGSPRGPRTVAFWNPPRIRATRRRSRRSANVEAHELYAALVAAGVPTIVFSKAKVTAELIHRYAVETLAASAPGLASKVTPYRGGYLPEERREIERRLFSGELLGVSTTPALELGIDVGGLDAAIVVGWPGTVSSFRQQAGRAGRRDREALVVLVGHDNAINQFVLRHPEMVLDRPAEDAAVEPDNPFVVLGHLRAAAHELPLPAAEAPAFGPGAGVVLDVLEANRKIRRIGGTAYHAASETPQHEVSLRDATDRNVIVRDVETGRILGEVSKFDSQSLTHPGAIYLHRGETWLVLDLDLETSVAHVRREETDYYTQALGGDDVHHVDRVLRSRPFGRGRAAYGEVTAYFRVYAYEKIRFYTLDAVSRHGVDLPTWPVETAAFWFEPPEETLADLRRDGMDPVGGLRGIGFATRSLLPLFVSAKVLDLSHSIGAVNAPWRTVFVFEHYPAGAGYAARGYERLGEILTAVRRGVAECPCRRGCPLCVGKPLRSETVANPERGEGAIPDKRASLRILDGLLGDGTGLEEPDEETLADDGDALRERLSLALRRRLEQMREPDVLHPVAPVPPRGPPPREADAGLGVPDAAVRGDRRRETARRLRLRADRDRRRST